jgi:hypothetical protein
MYLLINPHIYTYLLTSILAYKHTCLQTYLLTNIHTQLARTAAVLEVYQGLYCIFELVLPSRNIMQLYVWWQYLKMRYMVDQTGMCVYALYL